MEKNYQTISNDATNQDDLDYGHQATTCIYQDICKKPTQPPTKLGHQKFSLNSLDEPAKYGVLEKLEGTWVNTDKTNYGIHTTCMPSPGTNSETIPGKFSFLCENFTEELKFTSIPRTVRNRGGANEQLVGAIKYEQQVTSLKTGKPIHDEVGMYLWLDDMFNHPASGESIMDDIGFPELTVGSGSDGPTFVPQRKIARSGTIPHGNSILLLGDYVSNIGKPQFPEGEKTWDFDHLAISLSMGGADTDRGKQPINLDKPAPSWVHDQSLPVRDPSGNKTYTQRILAHENYPYSVRPDLRLRDTIKDQEIKSYDLITLDTEFDNGQGPQGGITSTPMVSKHTPVKKMTQRLWIETVVEDGKEVMQLQYEQVMFFAFQFGTDGGVTLWPHIQVNTLRKKESVEERN